MEAQAAANSQGKPVEAISNEESPSSNTPFVVKRLVGQREKLREQNGNLDSENNDLAKEVARLTQENEKLKSVPSNNDLLPPDVRTFNTQEDYQHAQDAYKTAIGKQAVDQVLLNQAQANRQTSFNSKIDEHYQKVEKSGKADYEEAELNVLVELGQDFLDGVVNNSDNSNEILYMLGHSAEEMKRIKNLIQTNPVKATLEIGRLSVNAGSFNRSDTSPVPEVVLTRGGSPKVVAGNLKAQYEQAVTAAAETGETSGLRNLRKQMRDAGLL
jgi:hypothetical protein